MLSKDIYDLVKFINGSNAMLLDALPAFVWMKDLDGVYLGCNKLFAEKMGLDNKNMIIGRKDSVKEFPGIPKPYFDEIEANCARVIEEKRAITFHENFADHLGNPERYRSVISPMFYQGKLVGIMRVAIMLEQSVIKEPTFTLRQKQCLQLLAKGKTFKEIANALNITPRTVRFHLDLVKKQLSVKTKSQLIEYYLRTTAEEVE